MKPSSGDGLGEILPVIFQRRAGVLMVLEGYFDESYREDHRLRPVCVAGFAFEQDAYRWFSAAWAKMLASGPKPLPYFHMTELYSDRSELHDGWSIVDRVALLRGACAAIADHMLFGVSAAFNKGELLSAAPNWEAKYGDVYAMACQIALQGSESWLDKHNRSDSMAYVFERGHHLWHQADAMLSGMAAGYGPKKSYRYMSHTAMDKQEAYGLQAADMLAWISTRLIVGWPKTHTMREFLPILHVLSLDDESKYSWFHIFGERISDFINFQEASTGKFAIRADRTPPPTPKTKKTQRKRGRTK